MLSIIIPTLNEEKYIGNLLESLKNQSYKDFEIIVIDAGSSDKTGEVVSKADVGEIPLKFINLNVKNVSLQRNKGAAMAKGDLLLFLDADIRFSTETDLEKLVKAFDNKKIIAATTKVMVDPLERRFIDSFFGFFINSIISIFNRIGIGDSRGACQAVRKNCFDEIKFNTKAHVGEDVQLFMRLARKGKTVYLKDIAVYESARRYRQQGYLKILFSWSVDGIWVMLTGKSYTKEREDIR